MEVQVLLLCFFILSLCLCIYLLVCLSVLLPFCACLSVFFLAFYFLFDYFCLVLLPSVVLFASYSLSLLPPCFSHPFFIPPSFPPSFFPALTISSPNIPPFLPHKPSVSCPSLLLSPSFSLFPSFLPSPFLLPASRWEQTKCLTETDEIIYSRPSFLHLTADRLDSITQVSIGEKGWRFETLDRNLCFVFLDILPYILRCLCFLFIVPFIV